MTIHQRQQTPRTLLKLMASSPEDFYISTTEPSFRCLELAGEFRLSVTNLPPIVYAGLDSTNVFTALPARGRPRGSSYDQDDLPAPNQVTNLWSKISGPANVSFTYPTLLSSSVTFTQVGVYTLQMLAQILIWRPRIR